MITSSTSSSQLTDAQLTKYAELIYRVTGITISPQKKALLSNRIRKRLKANNLSCYDEYLTWLKKQPTSHAEWDAFLQEVTTHETYLFRDPSHWDWFQNVYLMQIQKEATAGQRKKELCVWSAACSNGDEAYTIAMCIASRLRNASEWKIRIMATDIGVDAIAKAKAGVFEAKSIRHVPADFQSRYFTQQDNQWTAKPNIRGWFEFKQHNLLDRAPVSNVDVVFVKNVLIYFDDQSKQKVLTHVDRALKSGGHLVAGPAECVSQMLDKMEKPKPWLYRKP